MRLAAGFVLNLVVFYPPLYMDHFYGFRLKKAMGDHGIKWGENALLDFDYADDYGILDESVSKMKELLRFCEKKVLEYA